jgi:hypothetical protein
MTYPSTCPVADKYEWLPEATFTGGPLNASRGLVLHVNAGNGDPFNWWTNPAAPTASSHFQVMKDGTLIQYVRCDLVAYAQIAGNGSWHSVETEGFPTEPLTDAQVAKLGSLYAWGHANCGWAMQLTDDPNGAGFGWHGMGGAAWGGHYGCPGDLRKAQRQHILDLASGADMPLTQQEIANIAQAVWMQDIGGVHARDRLQGVDSIQLPALSRAVAAIQPAKVDVAALAAQIVAALPAAEAQQVADLVIAGIGQRIVTAKP